MKARWGGMCGKCGTAWFQGDDIKPQYRRAGFNDGNPIWVRVPKSYVHAPRCPKPPPGVDPQTGEILMDDTPRLFG
jgi:hypothetical protein